MGRFLPLLGVEGIKLRRSWPMLMAILAPMCQFLFIFLIFRFSEDRVGMIGQGFQVWYQVHFLAWNLFFLPVLVALVAALSWELEEEAGAWRHLLVQPVSRQVHFLVKIVSQVLLVWLGQGVLLGLLVAGGVLLRAQVPLLEMGSSRPEMLLRLSSESLVAACPLVAFHAWLSMRYPGLGLSLVLAGGGSWLTAHLISQSWVAKILPWGLASGVSQEFRGAGAPAVGAYGFALLATAIFVSVGLRGFLQRDQLDR